MKNSAPDGHLRLPASAMLPAIAVLQAGGVLLGLCLSLLVPGISALWRAGFVIASGLVAAGLLLQWRQPRRNGNASDEGDPRESLEALRTALLAELDQRDSRLTEREQRLNEQTLRFQEFLEYPVTPRDADVSPEQATRLGEQDRQVRTLLEDEAAKFYEKIRTNGYSSGDGLNVRMIRDDAVDLMRRVATIYKPDSANPLLETSFDQLARAASRICLQTLVLLERLPVQVQHYSISTMYGYFRKAVVGYGVYQKASPWLTYLSRGLYAGRLAATTNPVSLGTWWLASEVGRYGAKKVVENVVDRQAIAVLHDLVSILGVEIAGIYGTGFRQRDPAWILGAELVELIQSFPQSGESLRQGLTRITGLPLRSEYDRIYLYRCLAGHKSVGMQLADATQLSREEREAMARDLENFFASHIHGATDKATQRWREGLEHRFDIRLQLSLPPLAANQSREQQLESAARSLAGFIVSVAAVATSRRASVFTRLKTVTALPAATRDLLTSEMGHDSADCPFAPPELDPASPLTADYLDDLARCGVETSQPDDSVEQLVRESFAYFRRPAREADEALEAAWKDRLTGGRPASDPMLKLPAGAARSYFAVVETDGSDETVSLAYDGIGFQKEDSIVELPGVLMLGLSSGSGGVSAPGGSGVSRRLVLLQHGSDSRILWECRVPVRVVRSRGLLLDDARIQQGTWTADAALLQVPPTADVLVTGSLRGGRYATYFRDLLSFAEG